MTTPPASSVVTDATRDNGHLRGRPSLSLLKVNGASPTNATGHATGDTFHGRPSPSLSFNNFNFLSAAPTGISGCGSLEPTPLTVNDTSPTNAKGRATGDAFHGRPSSALKSGAKQ
ncbi:MAG: hypothetical protein MPL62_00350 [Alphaproteobacteria bacterium]|nr:hypothetical protein [Alphaproteobacteria bacterium]